MEEKGESFEDALKQAQKLGFAEADPTADVEAFDVAYKLSILSALAFGSFVQPDSIYRKGISNLTAADIKTARDFGYRIKLLGVTQKVNGHVHVRVLPTLVPLSHSLATVSGSNNGIIVAGHAVGEIMMVGPGAGEMPTASAVVGDTLNLASALQLPDFASYFQSPINANWAKVAPAGDWECPYFLKLLVDDSPGVIGHIGTICGAHKISIRSVIQPEAAKEAASIVIITHSTPSSEVERALAYMEKKSFLRKIESCLPIYDPAKNA
jgi:homoserine dehydrogenase